MFKFFKKQCPICKMILDKNKDYPQGFGKTFCSEECKEEYRKKTAGEKSENSKGGCCH